MGASPWALSHFHYHPLSHDSLFILSTSVKALCYFYLMLEYSHTLIPALFTLPTRFSTSPNASPALFLSSLFVLTTHSDFEALSVIACLRLVSHLCNGVKPKLRQVKLDCESPNVCPFCFSLKAGGSRGLRASLHERRGGEQRGGGRGAHSRRTR